MADEHAASSPAEVDPFNGIEPTLQEFSEWRTTGKVGERFAPPAEKAEAAPADEPEETASEGEPESAGDSETPQHQEPKKPRTAAQRIAQLEAAIEQEWEKEEPDPVRVAQLNATIEKIRGRVERKTDPAPVAQQESKPQPQAQPQQYTRPKPSVDAKDDQGNPKYATYEDYVEDLADWKAEQREVAFRREFAQQEALKAFRSKLDEASARYENAEQVIVPTLQKLNEAPIHPQLKEVIGSSDVFADLGYVLGSEPGALEEFVSLAQRNPRAALAKVFEYEAAIREELAKPEQQRGKDGKFIAEKAPEKRETKAPKPPTPVSGGASRAFDVNDESLDADEWARKRNAQVSRRS